MVRYGTVLACCDLDEDDDDDDDDGAGLARSCYLRTNLLTCTCRYTSTVCFCRSLSP
jgi:hypothetical protein